MNSEHVEVLREGWQVVGDGHEIAHIDFGTDVSLSLSGDFATNQERAQFAQALADRLNAAPAEAQPCGCGEAACTAPWEPGCGLGKSEQHAEAQAQGGGECCHSWQDYGQMNVVRCNKCEARAVNGYEDRPFTAPPSAPVGVEVKVLARDVHYAIRDAGLAPESPADDAAMRDAILRTLAQQPAAVDDAALLDALAREYWKLDPFDMPTPGGDDADVGWRVIEYHGDEPREREVAVHYADDPRAALRAALAAQHQEPTT